MLRVRQLNIGLDYGHDTHVLVWFVLFETMSCKIVLAGICYVSQADLKLVDPPASALKC